MGNKLKTYAQWVAAKYQAGPTRRLLWSAAVIALIVLAFCWGRHGAWSQAPTGQLSPADRALLAPSLSDYSQRVVAYLYGTVPLTREDFGEFLISRFASPERLEFFVNCQILERACKAKGILVTDAEVDAQVIQDVRTFGGPSMRLVDFERQLLEKKNKTLLEYKEDVVRHRIALSKLVRSSLTVSEDDLRKAFEAKYGPKVQCRMIQFMPEDRRRFEICQKVKESEAAFAEYAGKQFNQFLQSQGGKCPPIHKHFGDPQIEKRAFSLQVGEVSELIQIEDKSWIILKCDEHIKPNMAAKFEVERMSLFKEVSEFRVAQEMPKVFAQLRQEANPRILLANRPMRAADLEREVRKEIEPTSANSPRPTPPK